MIPAPPVEIRYLTEVLGIEATLDLMRLYGGSRVYVPANPTEDKPAEDKPMTSIKTLPADAFRLALPYFVSEERWPARLKLGAIIALNLALVGLTVLLNSWQGQFYNALQDKDWDSFIALILTWRPPEPRRSGLARYVYSDVGSRSATYADKALERFLSIQTSSLRPGARLAGLPPAHW
jgi:hypothetical protein